MCTSKSNFALICIFILITVFPVVVLSQEWSKDQQEAWSMVEKMMDFWAKRDLDGYMSCLHENYVGWYHNDPLPINKESLRNWESHWLSAAKIIRYEIRPVSIVITDDVAIISYYLSSLRTDEQGDKLSFSKWTDVLKKQDGKWLVLGSHGGRTSLSPLSN